MKEKRKKENASHSQTRREVARAEVKEDGEVPPRKMERNVTMCKPAGEPSSEVCLISL